MNVQCRRCAYIFPPDKQRDVVLANVITGEARVKTTCPACTQEIEPPITMEQARDLIRGGFTHVITEEAEYDEEDEVRRRYPVPASEPQPEPEPPREWIMSLMDTIRHFTQKCGADCEHMAVSRES